jgi:hypothetical protein
MLLDQMRGRLPELEGWLSQTKLRLETIARDGEIAKLTDTLTAIRWEN